MASSLNFYCERGGILDLAIAILQCINPRLFSQPRRISFWMQAGVALAYLVFIFLWIYAEIIERRKKWGAHLQPIQFFFTWKLLILWSERAMHCIQKIHHIISHFQPHHSTYPALAGNLCDPENKGRDICSGSIMSRSKKTMHWKEEALRLWKFQNWGLLRQAAAKTHLMRAIHIAAAVLSSKLFMWKLSTSLCEVLPCSLSLFLWGWIWLWARSLTIGDKSSKHTKPASSVTLGPQGRPIHEVCGYEHVLGILNQS